MFENFVFEQKIPRMCLFKRANLAGANFYLYND